MTTFLDVSLTPLRYPFTPEMLRERGTEIANGLRASDVFPTSDLVWSYVLAEALNVVAELPKADQ